MTVHVHIERLVLDGLPLGPGDGPAVQTAVEAELTRLLAERGLAPALERGGALDSVRGADLQLPPAAPANAVGTQIGGAIHRSLSR